ncbi:MFS transporter [Blastococcus tunisiensis]|uniref:MFS transporter, CP family, cyanate transporter n=1 Tax=Blastococcus tunisiensis TaxID=1798228 RepID=A0A1I2L685_9ACTN|nr:MFS transporter [Blastococcus sp. DSM 46838]SFF74842.1 MFS transporter, CP family, cyanate transporter [Blastococcus sp. DSM 46838]
MDGEAGRGNGLLLVAVLLAALNLRGAIAAVAPVLPELRAELGLTPTTAGLLTTLPVLCFAALAPAAAWLGRVVGTRTAVLAGLVAIAVGSVVRVLGGPVVLLAGTFVVGAAMTVGNVLLPVVVKARFAARAGTVTGLYTGTLAGGAGLTIALTAPVAAVWGWRTGLGVWSLLAVVSAAVWLAATGRFPPPGDPRPDDRAAGPGVASVWRSPVAWAASVVLATQSVLYYAFTTWLPSVLVEDAGLGLSAAAAAASVFQLLGIPGALLVPLALARLRAQRGLALGVATAWALTPLGLLLQPGLWPVWVGLGGLVQGAGISLAFALVALRGADEDAVRRLSAMTQLVGYALGAVGPLVVGALYAATGSWSAPLALLVLVAAVQAVAGTVAGRPVLVGR